MKQSDVKQKFVESFPKPPFRVNREILAPPSTEHNSVVGTAFDYLLRFFLEYSYSQTISDEWIAEKAAFSFAHEFATELIQYLAQ